MNRRKFLQTAATLAVAAGPGVTLGATPQWKAMARHLPRWRGFNLTEKCVKFRDPNPPYREEDFKLLKEWGFNFARLPLSYLLWSDEKDWLKIHDDELKDIDDAVEMGRQYGVHTNLNLHRAPGYCVNAPKEALDLWTNEKAQDACAFHWGWLARRYKGIPSEQLSFDLLNEPSNVSEEAYVRVVKRLTKAIRDIDPERLIIADGLQWGRDPVYGLAKLDIAQSTRGYDPMPLTHYKANWVKSENWPEPAWPLETKDKGLMNKESLRKERITPWRKLELTGVGVHVGEWGVFNQTPHKVAVAWMRDCLELWKEVGWGWSLWNFRGAFGVMDSRRTDVQYETVGEHKLDREMLTLLQAY
jgi:endoglucanase